MDVTLARNLDFGVVNKINCYMEEFNDPPPVLLDRRSARKSWDLNPGSVLKIYRK